MSDIERALAPAKRRRARNLRVMLIACIAYMGVLLAAAVGHYYTVLGLVLIGALAVFSLEDE